MVEGERHKLQYVRYVCSGALYKNFNLPMVYVYSEYTRVCRSRVSEMAKPLPVGWQISSRKAANLTTIRHISIEKRLRLFYIWSEISINRGVRAQSPLQHMSMFHWRIAPFWLTTCCWRVNGVSTRAIRVRNAAASRQHLKYSCGRPLWSHVLVE